MFEIPKTDCPWLSVYAVKGGVFLQASHRTTIGIWRLSGPVDQAPQEDLEAIGRALLTNFARPRGIVPATKPDENVDKNSPMLEATGFRSWNQLMKKSLSIDAEKKEESVIFTPMVFLGTSGDRKGYDWSDDNNITTSDLSPRNLGQFLMEAVALSVNPYLKDKDDIKKT